MIACTDERTTCALQSPSPCPPNPERTLFGVVRLPDARGIVAAACARAGLTEAIIYGRQRYQSISRVRHAVWAELHAAGLSYPEIGILFGRDHTTIIVGVEGHAQRQLGHSEPRKCWSGPPARHVVEAHIKRSRGAL
jgi:Bacterial dnaA protein helix-turn-helix